jgi:hypothetical protein
VKKNKAKTGERQVDPRSDTERKQAVAPPVRPGEDGLTCNEAQIEDILSDGEST